MNLEIISLEYMLNEKTCWVIKNRIWDLNLFTWEEKSDNKLQEMYYKVIFINYKDIEIRKMYKNCITRLSL